MSRMGFAEIVPGHLYQRGQMLGWSAADKDRALRELGVTVVVNLWHKVDPDLSSRDDGFVYLNWRCPGDEARPEAEPIVEFLAGLLDMGRTVLIQCEAGVNRSVWLCALVLAQHTGMPAMEALGQVEQRVGRVKLNRVLNADIMNRA